jgi:GR25 family glycosyltransferase involved in LPS biosynthesis
METNLLPIFIINLPKDTDRRLFMEKQMQDFGLQFQFIEGKLGSDPEVLANCDDALAIKEHGKVLTTGEKGCAYAHKSVYEKMLREDIPYALILEDDVVLHKNFRDVLDSVMRGDKSFDWLSLEYAKIGLPFIKAWIVASGRMTKKNLLFFLYALLKFPFILILSLFESLRNRLAQVWPSYAGIKIFYRPMYNAGAYIITKEGIRKIIPLLTPLRFSADRVPSQARVRSGFKQRWYVPRAAHQTDEDEGNTFVSNTLV